MKLVGFEIVLDDCAESAEEITDLLCKQFGDNIVGLRVSGGYFPKERRIKTRFASGLTEVRDFLAKRGYIVE